MFAVNDLHLTTKVRLTDGTECYIRGHHPNPPTIYQTAQVLRLERDWLAGKISDDEAEKLGLTAELQHKLRTDPSYRDSEHPFFTNWIRFEPGDTILETTSIDIPIIRLQDIVAIKPNGEEWIEDPAQKEEL